MTTTTTVLGLLPLLLSHGIGSEVQRPLATVVVFGLTSATFLIDSESNLKAALQDLEGQETVQ
mgnify:CR=1 FL=1